MVIATNMISNTDSMSRPGASFRGSSSASSQEVTAIRFDATPLTPAAVTLLLAPTTSRTLLPVSAEVSVNVVAAPRTSGCAVGAVEVGALVEQRFSRAA
jgi:hypothetical protein